MTKPVYTLRTLLTQLVDYAGLFPPAKLDMQPAVDEYAHQRQSAESWMLGRFIVPLARIDAFEQAAAERLPGAGGKTGGDIWGLSVLAGADPVTERRRIDLFNSTYLGRARIEAIELKASSPDDVERLAPHFQGFEIYFEIPATEDPRPFVPALRRVSGRGKIRTGGMTPDLIPESEAVARFISVLSREHLPFKATAGLHHPLRGEYPLTYEANGATGTMFGFLNVFLAAVFAQQGELDENGLKELLEERSVDAFQFDDTKACWKGHCVDVAALALARKLVAMSYGSCSFAEPVADLRALDLL